MRRVDVHHNLQQRRDSGSGRLLKPRDRLPKGKTARIPVGGWNSGSFIHFNSVLGSRPTTLAGRSPG
jgi:hypothetical protein